MNNMLVQFTKSYWVGFSVLFSQCKYQIIFQLHVEEEKLIKLPFLFLILYSEFKNSINFFWPHNVLQRDRLYQPIILLFVYMPFTREKEHNMPFKFYFSSVYFFLLFIPFTSLFLHFLHFLFLFLFLVDNDNSVENSRINLSFIFVRNENVWTLYKMKDPLIYYFKVLSKDWC